MSRIVLSSNLKANDTFHELNQPWKVPMSLIVPRKYTNTDGSLLLEKVTTEQTSMSRSAIYSLNQKTSNQNKDVIASQEALETINQTINDNPELTEDQNYKTKKVSLPTFQDMSKTDILFIIDILERPILTNNVFINLSDNLFNKKTFIEHELFLYNQTKTVIKQFCTDFIGAKEINFPEMEILIGQGWSHIEHKAQQNVLRNAFFRHLARFHAKTLISQWKSPLNTAELYNKLYLKSDKAGITILFTHLSKKNLKKLLSQWSAFEFIHDPVLYLASDIPPMTDAIRKELLRRE